MTKLNPCPNCGNEPDIATNPVASYVHCSSCDDGLSVKSKTANGAMNAWNAATGDNPIKTLRDEFAMAALTGMLSYCGDETRGSRASAFTGRT